jgi:hypothetical protein
MPLNKDIHLTTEVLTLIRAGFYGQILFEGAMDRLKSAILPAGYLDIAHKAFDKLDIWSKDLHENLPLFSVNWSQPETFDAISAMNFLRDLKRDLLELTPQVEQALADRDLWNNRDGVKLLAASILRTAATRSSYVETITQIFMKLGAPEYAQGPSFEIDGARDYMRTANMIVDTFSTGAVYEVELCERLRAEAKLIPSYFLSTVHDINILTNVFSKEFTFEKAEFSQDEAAPWVSKQIPAVAAGYWRAYGFSPDEFLMWSSIGIPAAPVAAGWRRARFAPQDAIEWIREGVSPAFAEPWRAAGFEPQRAASLIRRGITDPSRAPKPTSEDD